MTLTNVGVFKQTTNASLTFQLLVIYENRNSMLKWAKKLYVKGTVNMTSHFNLTLLPCVLFRIVSWL